MSEKTVKIEYQGMEVKPAFGGMKYQPVYIMSPFIRGYVNHYRITCDIEGDWIADS